MIILLWLRREIKMVFVNNFTIDSITLKDMWIPATEYDQVSFQEVNPVLSLSLELCRPAFILGPEWGEEVEWV